MLIKLLQVSNLQRDLASDASYRSRRVLLSVVPTDTDATFFPSNLQPIIFSAARKKRRFFPLSMKIVVPRRSLTRAFSDRSTSSWKINNFHLSRARA